MKQKDKPKKKPKKKKRKKDPKYVQEKYKEVLKGQKSKDEGKAKGDSDYMGQTKCEEAAHVMSPVFCEVYLCA